MVARHPDLRYCGAMPPPFWLPHPIRAVLTPDRLRLGQQFLQFGIIGFAGFLVDTAVVYALRGLVGLIAAGLLSYFAAVTTTWAGNRAWTFAGRRQGGAARQWLLFVAANGVGFVLNRGAFFLLVWNVPACAAHPVLAILAGVAAGLLANFNLSRRVVFSGRGR